MPSRAFPPVRFVACCICGHLHQAGGTEVLYRSADQRWWCRNEMAYRKRARARALAVAHA